MSCVGILLLQTWPQLQLFQQVKGDYDISKATATSSDGSGGSPCTQARDTRPVHVRRFGDEKSTLDMIVVMFSTAVVIGAAAEPLCFVHE